MTDEGPIFYPAPAHYCAQDRSPEEERRLGSRGSYWPDCLSPAAGGIHTAPTCTHMVYSDKLRLYIKHLLATGWKTEFKQ